MPAKTPLQIACQQVLQEDSSVFSIQWTDLPSELAGELTPSCLLERYLDAIRRMTWGLIRPKVTAVGISFGLFGRLSLLCFLKPEPEGDWLALRICGGLLVQRDQCERGELAFRCEPLPDGPVRVTLRLSDYCPLLLGSQRPSVVRRWLYRLTQATLHRLVTVRFLALLYRELGGGLRRVETVQVRVREGRVT
ncbi:hypothetical protein FY034_01765 [Trichlorobacter lovleyi]|uniref:hypothetical protein n=1 Tax=Trichlorobacter lovleyi TaxID=313985 RepID=UPI00223F9DDA|nr:hypothetical protein [Trichlorobacter lovleyi]QOX77715.1 hypothetical protein FY034_01765 [Trichlorobacter lovleyi]